MNIIKLICVLIFFVVFACKEQNNYDINVMFSRVDNVVIGSEVKLNGLDIGSVSKMKMIKDSILVRVTIDKKIKIPTGSLFQISSPFIGSAYVYVTPSTNKFFISNNDTISGVYEKTNLLDEITKDSITKKKVMDAVEKIKEGFDDLIKARKDSIQ